MSDDEIEVRGVRLRDMFRDTSGELWEVVGLCTDPMAIVRNVASSDGTPCHRLLELAVEVAERATPRIAAGLRGNEQR